MGGGLVHFNIQTGIFTNYPPLPNEYARENLARNIIFDLDFCTDTSLYIISNEGLFEFNLPDKKFTLESGPQNQNGKAVSQVFTSITHTSDGSTWVCSPENIFQKHPVYQRLGTFQTFYQPGEKYVYEPSLSSVLYRKDKGQYWMSCNAGYGIYVYDDNFQYLYSIPNEGLAADRQLRNIVEDKSGNIWLRSRDAPFLYYYDFEELLPEDVFFRTHHSHLTNLNYIKRYIKGDGGQIVLQNGDYVDVSRRKKDEFLKAIGY